MPVSLIAGRGQAAPAVGGSGSVTVTSVTPGYGAAGDTVVLAGTGFTSPAGSQAVLCAGVSFTDIVVDSAAQITAKIPAGVSGLCDVSVAGVTLPASLTIGPPLPAATYKLDTRAGGVQDIAAVNTLGAATTLTGI